MPWPVRPCAQAAVAPLTCGKSVTSFGVRRLRGRGDRRAVARAAVGRLDRRVDRYVGDAGRETERAELRRRDRAADRVDQRERRYVGRAERGEGGAGARPVDDHVDRACARRCAFAWAAWATCASVGIDGRHDRERDAGTTAAGGRKRPGGSRLVRGRAGRRPASPRGTRASSPLARPSRSGWRRSLRGAGFVAASRVARSDHDVLRPPGPSSALLAVGLCEAAGAPNGGGVVERERCRGQDENNSGEQADDEPRRESGAQSVHSYVSATTSAAKPHQKGDSLKFPGTGERGAASVARLHSTGGKLAPSA